MLPVIIIGGFRSHVHPDRSGRGGGILCVIRFTVYLSRIKKLKDLYKVILAAAKTTAVVMFCGGGKRNRLVDYRRGTAANMTELLELLIDSPTILSLSLCLPCLLSVW